MTRMIRYNRPLSPTSWQQCWFRSFSVYWKMNVLLLSELSLCFVFPLQFILVTSRFLLSKLKLASLFLCSLVKWGRREGPKSCQSCSEEQQPYDLKLDQKENPGCLSWTACFTWTHADAYPWTQTLIRGWLGIQYLHYLSAWGCQLQHCWTTV